MGAEFDQKKINNEGRVYKTSDADNINAAYVHHSSRMIIIISVAI